MSTKKAFVKKPTFYQRSNLFRILLFLTILATGILTLLVNQFDYFKVDLIITKTVQEIRLTPFDLLMRLLSTIGDVEFGTAIILCVSGYLWFIGKIKSAIATILSSYGAIVVSEAIKIIVGRPRPDANLIEQVGKFLRADSYPSGHVLFAIGLYGFLFFLVFTQLKKRLLLRTTLLVVTITPILLMGVSRIYLGAHWFSDVLGAYLIGYIWLFVVISLYNFSDPKVQPTK